MCMRQSWGDSMGDMDMKVFQSLLPSFAKLDSLSLSGYGEPFLNPQLPDMIRLARERLPNHATITLTSNGTLIEEHMAREVLAAGLDGISLSMDSLEANEFMAIRGGTPITTVVDRLKTFVNLKRKLKKESFHIGISFVAMKRNIQELPWLIQFAADNNVNAIWVNNVLPHTELVSKETLYGSYSEEVLDTLITTKERLNELGVNPSAFRTLSKDLSIKRYRGGVLNLSPEEELVVQCIQQLSSGQSFGATTGGNLNNLLNVLESDETEFFEYINIFEESKKRASSRSIKLHLPLIIPRAERKCDFIEKESCFVTWDGWVRPCNQLSHDYICFHYGRPKTVRSVSFGKVPEEDLEAIWNSQPYRTFRENVEKFPFSPCGDCGLAEGCGYIHSDVKFFSDCNMYEQPCGDCLWSRGLLHCP
jgi:putative metalloenzyme radical SAM/SPASM domain maturase